MPAAGAGRGERNGGEQFRRDRAGTVLANQITETQHQYGSARQ